MNLKVWQLFYSCFVQYRAMQERSLYWIGTMMKESAIRIQCYPSLLMREIISPAAVLSKKLTGNVIRWSKTSLSISAVTFEPMRIISTWVSQAQREEAPTQRAILIQSAMTFSKLTLCAVPIASIALPAKEGINKARILENRVMAAAVNNSTLCLIR